jgi:NADH dehydrogenase [ubiquinone] 1 alpha subcomplex assembly factor 7
MQRLDEFMGEALTAYYNSRDPLGVDGDFTTAPEISQLFGEIIGIWAVQQWVKLESPTAINLIEIGPGRGTLMADLLRGTQHITAFHDALSIHLIETSEFLKQKQYQTLCHCEEHSDTAIHTLSKSHGLLRFARNNVDIYCHDHLSAIKNNKPSIIIANEFFDALPVRQFKRDNDKWLEHYIDGGQSVWQAIDTPPLKPTLPTVKEGDIFEYSTAQENYAELMSTYHGAALIIDYGYKKSAYGDSVQALYKHQSCAITDHIGEADLTSHIDFEWLASLFKNTAIKTQADFLNENGIAIRYHQLNNSSLRSGYERLVHADQMGKLFKALEIFNSKP